MGPKVPHLVHLQCIQLEKRVYGIHGTLVCMWNVNYTLQCFTSCHPGISTVWRGCETFWTWELRSRSGDTRNEWHMVYNWDPKASRDLFLFLFLVQWGPGITLLPLGSLLFLDHYDGLYPSKLGTHTDPTFLKLLLSAGLSGGWEETISSQISLLFPH